MFVIKECFGKSRRISNGKRAASPQHNDKGRLATWASVQILQWTPRWNSNKQEKIISKYNMVRMLRFKKHSRWRGPWGRTEQELVYGWVGSAITTVQYNLQKGREEEAFDVAVGYEISPKRNSRKLRLSPLPTLHHIQQNLHRQQGTRTGSALTHSIHTPPHGHQNIQTNSPTRTAASFPNAYQSGWYRLEQQSVNLSFKIPQATLEMPCFFR